VWYFVPGEAVGYRCTPINAGLAKDAKIKAALSLSKTEMPGSPIP